uniref:Uncharacterized protein n=1 Tax=Rhizophora mucronata TaxID=61149 RepID=A0A2P2NWD1_RHIMU
MIIASSTLCWLQKIVASCLRLENFL